MQPALWMTIWLSLISAMDIRKRKVPAWLLGAGGILAVICYRQGISMNVWKGFLPGILLLLMSMMTKQVGYGDGIVLLILGYCSGGTSLLIFGIGLFLISLFSLGALALRRAGRNTRIPFLPFLTAAWIAVMGYL